MSYRGPLSLVDRFRSVRVRDESRFNVFTPKGVASTCEEASSGSTWACRESTGWWAGSEDYNASIYVCLYTRHISLTLQLDEEDL